MGSLGEFGAAVRAADETAEPDTFGYYGETFTVKQRVGSMPVLRFAAIALGGAEAESLEGLAAMHGLITACIIPEDVHRFEKVASDNDADTDEMMGICTALYRAVAGRPTSRPSDSSAGPSTTGETSKEPSSSAASLSPIQQDPRVRELVPVSKAALRLVG